MEVLGIMDSINNVYVTIDEEVLTKIFLKMLNTEGYINNKTYLAIEKEILKGDDGNVD